MKPYFETELGKLYCGDCLEITPQLDPVDLILTDPPYPNKSNHFIDGIDTARIFIARNIYPIVVFWDEMEIPETSIPLVAKHIWHRNNSNRPDNYEMIYFFHPNGLKRASRVLPFSVIYPGLTGCFEATGHPTQKNVKLIIKLIQVINIDGKILDPFLGSGTTAVACEQLNRRWIGIEISEKYCELAAKRIERERQQLKLFGPEIGVKKPKQEPMF